VLRPHAKRTDPGIHEVRRVSPRRVAGYVLRALSRVSERPIQVSIRQDRWSRITVIAQLLGVVVTGALAVAAFCQIRQSTRAARITVALAMHEFEPRFSMVDVDSANQPIVRKGDTVICTRHLRFRNLDAHPIRVISVTLTANHSMSSVVGVVFPTQASGDLIGLGDSLDRTVEQKVHMPANGPILSKLHLCATLRRDDQVRTFYYERVYDIVRAPVGVLQAAFTSTEYTGIVSGLGIILDPWYQPARDRLTDRLLRGAGHWGKRGTKTD
jgi:hypothetical protein